MRRRLALATLTLALSACGYRFVGRGAALPEGIRAVYVPVMANQTAEPGLEVVFTEALRYEFLRAGVSGSDLSDARVVGTVRAASGQVLTAGGANGVATFGVTATVHLRLQRGAQVVAETEVNGEESYLQGADVLGSESRRQAALRRLAAAMMRDAYERLASRY